VFLHLQGGRPPAADVELQSTTPDVAAWLGKTEPSRRRGATMCLATQQGRLTAAIARQAVKAASTGVG